MELKHQIGIGVSITISTAFILYLYTKITSPKPKPEARKARKILSKYHARPTAEDIKADNEFQGREVHDNQVSKSGIVYHDIRYPDECGNEKESSELEMSEENLMTDTNSINTILDDLEPKEEQLADEKTLADPPSYLPSLECSSNEVMEQALPVIAESKSVTVNAAAAVVTPRDNVSVQSNSFRDQEYKDSPNNAGASVSEHLSVTPSNNEAAPPSITSDSDTLATSDSDTLATSDSVISETSDSVSPTTNTASSTSAPISPYLSASSTTTTASSTSAPISPYLVSSTVTSNGVSGGLPTTQEFVRNVVRAKDKVEVNRARSDTELIQQIFNIPSKAVGKIIGKQGASIKGIQRKSGARLQFPNNRDRNAASQKLFVSGSLRQVEEAVAMLVSMMPSDSVCHDLITWTPQIALSGDLKPVELIENTLCVGRVTHVTSPDSVWVQICRGVTGTDYLTMLSTLTDNITETLGRKLYDLKSALISAENIKEGTSCAVMLEGRGYRGTVICPGTPGNEVHQVRLVDFGTPHTFTELFNLNSYFYTMPALAVQCSLAHIAKIQGDPIWPEGAALCLEESLAECFVKVRALDTSTSPTKVEIYTEPTETIKSTKYVNRELVYDGYASWVD